MEPTTSAQGSFATEGATIRIDPSGTVNVYVAGGSTGNSLETAAVQLTADALGVDIEDVATIQGDTALTPFGAGTGGSRSGSMIAGAVAETAGSLREKIIALAAHRLEAAEADIDLAARTCQRARHADRRSLVRGARVDRVLPATSLARRHGGRTRGERPVHRARSDALGERDACVHV